VGLKQQQFKALSRLIILEQLFACSAGSKTKGAHIPYRDSKLTRILQHSLGGNARTAIICTMSPAHSHIEQSRNTLAFATRAKEVTNSVHINMVCYKIPSVLWCYIGELRDDKILMELFMVICF
jgi:hypothetical protein